MRLPVQACASVDPSFRLLRLTPSSSSSSRHVLEHLHPSFRCAIGLLRVLFQSQSRTVLMVRPGRSIDASDPKRPDRVVKPVFKAPVDAMGREWAWRAETVKLHLEANLIVRSCTRAAFSNGTGMVRGPCDCDCPASLESLLTPRPVSCRSSRQEPCSRASPH